MDYWFQSVACCSQDIVLNHEVKHCHYEDGSKKLPNLIRIRVCVLFPRLL